jgi:tetratricopeptide (TPR) repeat protein
MKDRQVGSSMGRGTDPIADRFLRWSLRRRDVSDLICARRAIDRRQFEEAERHLRRALDLDTDSAEARSLMGVLHERLGEYHAAYRCYKQALELDRFDAVARGGLRRYCERFGYDFHSPAINPAVR